MREQEQKFALGNSKTERVSAPPSVWRPTWSARQVPTAMEAFSLVGKTPSHWHSACQVGQYSPRTVPVQSPYSPRTVPVQSPL